MKNFWKRAGWLFLAILFVGTALGISVYAVWYDSHQNKDSSSNKTTLNNNTCDITSIASSKTLPTPEIFKPEGDVTQLQNTDLDPGTGKQVKANDCLTVKYYGTLATDGTLFDENFDKPTALQLKLGTGQVIPGWDQGLVGMKVGGTRRIVIPPALGYGATGSCKAQNQKDPTKCDEYSIPPNTPLVFVVYLEAAK
jgi:peptidylprolyl isomerase